MQNNFIKFEDGKIINLNHILAVHPNYVLIGTCEIFLVNGVSYTLNIPDTKFLMTILNLDMWSNDDR